METCLNAPLAGGILKIPKQDAHNKGHLSPAENSSPNAFNLIETVLFPPK